MNDVVWPPPWWAVAAFAPSIPLMLWAMRSSRRQGPLLAAAVTLAALSLAEIGAWAWATFEPVTPPSRTMDDRPAPPGVNLPATLLPAPGRRPGVRDQRPRVLFIGDSFTEGLGVLTTHNFPTLVGHALDAEVINLGVAGTDTREQQLLWHHYGRTWQPDVVVWVFVLNDLAPLIPLGPDYLMRFEPRPVWGSYLVGMMHLVVAKRVTQAETIAGYRRSLDPSTDPEGIAVLERALTEVKRYVDARHGRLVFAIFPLMWELTDYPFAEGHAHIAAVAARAGAEVVDLLPAFRGEHAPDLWVSEFDHHPNARGHAIAAERLAVALRTGALAAATKPQSPPTPEQWLDDARMLQARDTPTLYSMRVAVTLATASAVLAGLEGGPQAGAFAAQALAFARECQNAMDHWRP